MPAKDPEIDAYISAAAPFARPILNHLRKVVHAGCPEVEETMKWSCPHFAYSGLMCGMAAFKNHCALRFWKASLIFGKDPESERAGMGPFGRITSLDDLPDEKTLIDYVRKAAELNAGGVKSQLRSKPQKSQPPKVPAYFAAALAKNKKAQTTFDRFSNSHRNEYLQWIAEAKREETRAQRLLKTLEWLSEGKPRNWKYR